MGATAQTRNAAAFQRDGRSQDATRHAGSRGCLMQEVAVHADLEGAKAPAPWGRRKGYSMGALRGRGRVLCARCGNEQCAASLACNLPSVWCEPSRRPDGRGATVWQSGRLSFLRGSGSVASEGMHVLRCV